MQYVCKARPGAEESPWGASDCILHKSGLRTHTLLLGVSVTCNSALPGGAGSWGPGRSWMTPQLDWQVPVVHSLCFMNNLTPNACLFCGCWDAFHTFSCRNSIRCSTSSWQPTYAIQHWDIELVQHFKNYMIKVKWYYLGSISPRECFQPSTMEYQETSSTFEKEVGFSNSKMARVALGLLRHKCFDQNLIKECRFCLLFRTVTASFTLKNRWNDLKPIILILMKEFSQRDFWGPLQGYQLTPSC